MIDTPLKFEIINFILDRWSAATDSKCHTWNIHDFFKPVVNNAIASSPFNAAVIAAGFDISIIIYFM